MCLELTAVQPLTSVTTDTDRRNTMPNRMGVTTTTNGRRIGRFLLRIQKT
uniref:Uncharacterized protein n=1 Tax=Ascaris lumbricoides TaxID=6252 RepID=A0A0M3HP98_ASCLU